MAIRKPQNAIRICISETDPRQVLLAKYLKSTGKITSQLMSAADAFYYSYALGVDRAISDAEVELELSESVLALSGQIHRILNFHRIDRGIILPNEFLAQCGLAWGSSPQSSMAISQQSTVTLPSVAKVNSPTPKPVKDRPVSELKADREEEDEIENSEIQISGMKVSQSVADFLNGSNGR
jgi:hypothetical protein